MTIEKVILFIALGGCLVVSIISFIKLVKADIERIEEYNKSKQKTNK